LLSLSTCGGCTSIDPRGIDNAEIIEAVHGRRAPMVPVSASRRLSGQPRPPVAQGESWISWAELPMPVAIARTDIAVIGTCPGRF
jgi:hypothetical protein